MLVGDRVSSKNRSFEVAVLINGVEQPLYRPRHDRDGKVFVVGQPGEAYTLRVRNLTSSRIEVINTVDGRHTLKDEPGDMRENQGLVISDPVGEITGWRINDDETRAFVFGEPEHSIAAQADTTKNIGVIGFAVYREQISPLGSLEPAIGYRGSADTFGDGMRSFATPKSGGLESMGSLGTGMGAVQQDRVGTTRFIRRTSQPDILIIGYDTEEKLREWGIIGPPEPNPFPGVGTGYTKYQTVPGI